MDWIELFLSFSLAFFDIEKGFILVVHHMYTWNIPIISMPINLKRSHFIWMYCSFYHTQLSATLALPLSSTTWGGCPKSYPSQRPGTAVIWPAECFSGMTVWLQGGLRKVGWSSCKHKYRSTTPNTLSHAILMWRLVKFRHCDLPH